MHKQTTLHCSPPLTQLAWSLVFYSRKWKPQKLSVAYLAELHWLAHRCEFPVLDDAFLDLFMFGQMYPWLKYKLASTEDIILTKVLMMATATKQSPQENFQHWSLTTQRKPIVYHKSFDDSTDYMYDGVHWT